MTATLTTTKSTRAIASKLSRLRSGKPLRTLDLFAGCGGLSLGFHAAGFAMAGAVEFDATAAASHGRNFFGVDEGCHAKPFDITQADPDGIVESFNLGRTTANAVDVLIGGPPCQAFARVGRAKLREIDDHPLAFKVDARGNLYLRYLHYIEQLQPLAVVIENVPDMLNYGGHNIAEEVAEVLEDRGYVARYTLLNSAFYGVPQMRERMFLVAIRKEIGQDIVFPKPTHHIELPVGYQGSRDVALKALKDSRTQRSLSFSDSRYLEPPAASRDLPMAVTVQEAIGDLPPITLHLEGKLKKGRQRLETLIAYDRRRRLSDYAQAMRSWPGFESDQGIREHVIRFLPRDYRIFKVMNPGDQYPQAHKCAIRLFNEELERLKTQGHRPRRGTSEYEALKKLFVPPYDPGKFPNKWRKMEADQPSRTLLAHLGKDSYSHIHYDSEQSRTISVREAARLQSFPDGFRFSGSMNAAFRQIGNAVPPLMSKAIAEQLWETLHRA